MQKMGRQEVALCLLHTVAVEKKGNALSEISFTLDFGCAEWEISEANLGNKFKAPNTTYTVLA